MNTLFISTIELAKRTGLTENKVRQLVYQKHFPKFRIEGGRFYIDARNASLFIRCEKPDSFQPSLPAWEETDRLISREELCRVSGISAKKMTLLLRRADFPKEKLGAGYYFHLQTVYLWFLKQLGTDIRS